MLHLWGYFKRMAWHELMLIPLLHTCSVLQLKNNIYVYIYIYTYVNSSLKKIHRELTIQRETQLWCEILMLPAHSIVTCVLQ